MVLFLVGFSLWTAEPRGITPHGGLHGHASAYITGMALEWLLLGYVWIGLNLRNVRMRDLIGERATFLGYLNDFGIGLLFMTVAGIVLKSLFASLVLIQNPVVRAILPRGRTELVLFLGLALTAGICEEIIFRGYLQRQLESLTRSKLAGVIIQGAIFGTTHGYQGSKFIWLTAVYGYMLGLLVHWRRSLRPGIVAHTLQDSMVGVIGYMINL